MFCQECGGAHSAKMEPSTSGAEKQTTRGRKGGKGQTKPSREPSHEPSRDTSPEEANTASMAVMSLEEKEQQLLMSIEKLELERRVEELERRHMRLLRDVPSRTTKKQPQPAEEDHEEELMAAGATAGAIFNQTAQGGEDDQNYSSYGTTRSRHRSRCKRRSRCSRSRSDSSSSGSRRRRSKWSLKKHTIGRKDMRRLNAYELIGASIRWALAIEGLNKVDYKALLEHIEFLTVRAMHDDFKDSAHVEYDLAVRVVAETKGFGAFSKANTGMSVSFYGAQHMRPKSSKTTGKTKTNKGEYTKDGTRPCYKWNQEGGCARTDSDCNYGHWCAKCGAKSHKKTACKD